MTATTVEYRASSVHYIYNYSRCCYYVLCIFRGVATKVYAMKKKRHYISFLFSPPFSPIYSWRINLREWHSQRTSRLLAKASAFLVPPGSDASCFRSHSRSKELEEDSEAEGGSWKAFSCVSDPRCERSSPAALSCSSRYRLGYVYDFSYSLKTHNKQTLYRQIHDWLIFTLVNSMHLLR